MLPHIFEQKWLRHVFNGQTKKLSYLLAIATCTKNFVSWTPVRCHLCPIQPSPVEILSNSIIPVKGRPKTIRFCVSKICRANVPCKATHIYTYYTVYYIHTAQGVTQGENLHNIYIQIHTVVTYTLHSTTVVTYTLHSTFMVRENIMIPLKVKSVQRIISKFKRKPHQHKQII